MTMLPITMAKPHDGVAPHRYVVMLRDTACETCGLCHTSVETYAETWLKSTVTGAKYIRNLRRLDEPPAYNIPKEVRTASDLFIPFCDNCVDGVDLSHLPKPSDESPRNVVSSLFDMDIVKKQRVADRFVDRRGQDRVVPLDKTGVTGNKKPQPKRAKTIDDLFNI